MKIQYCDICGMPTGRCDDDMIFFEHDGGRCAGPLCEACLSDLEESKKDSEKYDK